MKNISTSHTQSDDRDDALDNSILMDTNVLESQNIPATLSNYALAENDLVTAWLDQCNYLDTIPSYSTEIVNSVHILNCFRELCILLWLMNVRDEFSLSYRKLMEGKHFLSNTVSRLPKLLYYICRVNIVKMVSLTIKMPYKVNVIFSYLMIVRNAIL